MAKERNISINDLVGMEVSGISFVRDYVEIHFDGPILRCISNLTLESEEWQFTFPESGSRDSLCQLINQTIESIDLDENTMLKAKFSGGYELVVPLDQESRRGPEAMHFVPGINEPVQVW